MVTLRRRTTGLDFDCNVVELLPEDKDSRVTISRVWGLLLIS